MGKILKIKNISWIALGLIYLPAPFMVHYYPELMHFSYVFIALSVLIMLVNEPKWNFNKIAFFILAFVLSLTAEGIGVHTGWLFGNYHYGNGLGPKIFGVPLLIGILWSSLVYSWGVILQRLGFAKWLLVLLGAVLMVGFDFLLEKVAVYYGFWKWQGEIPLFNYVSWFLVAVVLFILFVFLGRSQKNKLTFGLIFGMVYLFLLLGWMEGFL